MRGRLSEHSAHRLRRRTPKQVPLLSVRFCPLSSAAGGRTSGAAKRVKRVRLGLFVPGPGALKGRRRTAWGFNPRYGLKITEAP
ncbi:MAG: hypothetical protein GY820_19845 [Gammaproteobacteria bacterium]|nr:hypothetical protein [Gammaproteobacteria bacterium]